MAQDDGPDGGLRAAAGRPGATSGPCSPRPWPTRSGPPSGATAGRKALAADLADLHLVAATVPDPDEGELAEVAAQLKAFGQGAGGPGRGAAEGEARRVDRDDRTSPRRGPREGGRACRGGAVRGPVGRRVRVRVPGRDGEGPTFRICPGARRGPGRRGGSSPGRGGRRPGVLNHPGVGTDGGNRGVPRSAAGSGDRSLVRGSPPAWH